MRVAAVDPERDRGADYVALDLTRASRDSRDDRLAIPKAHNAYSEPACQ
jgi:hypothetical protein